MSSYRYCCAPFFAIASLSLISVCSPLAGVAAIKPDFHLDSTPENTIVMLSAENPPILKIKSGQIVEIDTICLFGMTNEKPEQFFIDNGFPLDSTLSKQMLAVKAMIKALPKSGTAMTSPIYIEGAMPGDTLEVRILDIKSRAPYGVNSNRPGSGAIPDLVPRPYTKVVKLDLERNVAKFSDTIEIPLHQFEGRMAVSPVKEKGALPSGPPYPDIGGNMDNKHLGKGATVYFPVQVDGALFQVGDPHAVQGNGEAGQSALESSNTVTMQFILRKDKPIKIVEAETPTHYIVMGMDKDLNIAMHSAVANTVEFLKEHKNLEFTDALALCSFAVDYEVTEVVDGTKGIHGMIPKALFKDSKSTYWYHEGAATYTASR